jgi:hypothetical protein
MNTRDCVLILLVMPALTLAAKRDQEPAFQTSDRCMACHNELKTPSGRDVSIGFNWRSSIRPTPLATRIGKPAFAGKPSITLK